MKYKCNKCGFIHEGDMPDGYFCPLCGANLFEFKLIENKEEKVYNRTKIKEDNVCINRINEKCINCGVCAKTCENIVNIKYDKEKCDGVCINCGQCILTCPIGALTPKYDYKEVLNYINNKDYTVIAITSPAVRVGLGDAFHYEIGTFLEGKMVSALKTIGFDYVFDTTFGADLTSMEEANELKMRIKEGKTPMFSSCCPSWVSYASIYHPSLLSNLSTCKSPIGMEASIIKNYFAKEENLALDKLIIVAITPCTSKKAEIKNTDCNYALTTSELALMIKEEGIDFKNLKDENFDSLNGSSSGTIYGASSGVALSVLRVLYHELTGKDLTNDEILIEEKDYYTEIRLKINKEIIRCASVSTMINLEKVLKEKDNFHFIEVMNCNGGCIFGGGQILMPIGQKNELIEKRKKSLFKADKNAKIKYPYKNPIIKDLYEDYLEYPNSNLSHQLLHTKYQDQSYILNAKD